MVRRSRDLGLVLGVAAIQGLSLVTRLPGIPCPFRAGTGIPCPGCGLTRACGALVTGDWARMFRFHAMAPLVLVAAAWYLMVHHGPGKVRYISRDVWHALERRVSVPLVVGGTFVVYWLARLLFQGSGFIDLMSTRP
jgi:Protein of unknown function (DUF2752)